jgi:hypothetical protein
MKCSDEFAELRIRVRIPHLSGFKADSKSVNQATDQS